MTNLRNSIQKRLHRFGFRPRPVKKRAAPVVPSVALCMVRNEQDIIEPFLRHTARLVDLVIVLDNLSTDKTREIAMSTARELGNIVVTDWPDAGYNQSSTMTQLLHGVQSIVFADYVFFLDADEFIVADSASDLAARLKDIPPGQVGLMPWQTWVPDPKADLTSPDPLGWISLRRKVETPQYFKAVLRAGGATCDDMQVAQGNHQVLFENGQPLKSRELAQCPLIHIPLRSIDQMRAKSVVGWLANAKRQANGATSEAYQWRKLAEKFEADTHVSQDDLVREALAYAQEGPSFDLDTHAVAAPLPINVDRRYSDGSSMPAQDLIDHAKADVQSSRFELPPAPAGQSASAEIENAFEGAWHWDNIFLDRPPLAFAVELLQPTSIIDIGCGSGVYPKFYEFLGVSDILGVDGIEPEATVLGPNQYRKVDLQEPFDAGRTFDLVICLEVLEHIKPETTDTALDTIARHARDTILFSMAEPGQPGNGHINCRDMDFVLDAWARRGWVPDLPVTLGLRALSSMSWFRRNIVLLRRQDSADKNAEAHLRQIASRQYAWWSQVPGLRETAFQETRPDTSAGYGIHRV